jgi:hypothetical protein
MLAGREAVAHPKISHRAEDAPSLLVASEDLGIHCPLITDPGSAPTVARPTRKINRELYPSKPLLAPNRPHIRGERPDLLSFPEVLNNPSLHFGTLFAAKFAKSGRSGGLTPQRNVTCQANISHQTRPSKRPFSGYLVPVLLTFGPALGPNPSLTRYLPRFAHRQAQIAVYTA